LAMLMVPLQLRPRPLLSTTPLFPILSISSGTLQDLPSTWELQGNWLQVHVLQGNCFNHVQTFIYSHSYNSQDNHDFERLMRSPFTLFLCYAICAKNNYHIIRDECNCLLLIIEQIKFIPEECNFPLVINKQNESCK
jgi:hypothetical protein